jgi:uncharacterized RDD family membrane protein YckC
MEPDKGFSSISRRFAASAIDALLMLIPMLILGSIVPVLGHFVIGLLYKPFFESSPAQATPGKRIMGIIVSDLNGNRMTIKTALKRYLISFVSLLLLCIGHIVALFTSKKQTVHDLVAGTIVTEGKRGEHFFKECGDHLKFVFLRQW